MFLVEINHMNLKNNRGVALLLSVLLMALILFLTIYYLHSSLAESKIAVSQTSGAKTYYLAESGIAEIIWKLKNEPAYSDNFEALDDWSDSFTRNSPFGADSGSYTVTIANTSKAHADIISTGSININGKASQRVIKTKIYKPLGATSISSSAAFADGNIDISSSNVNFINGDASSNGNFIVNGVSTLNVDGDLNAVGNYIENWQATANITGTTRAANVPPAPPVMDMPAVDFDSAATSSLKNMADFIYTENQFEDLLEDNPNLTLNGIIYVIGEVEIKNPINLTINGLLVTSKEFKVEHGNGVNITVNNSPGAHSGIMSKSKIEFEDNMGDVNINGVLYAADQLDIKNLSSGGVFDVNGGMASRKLTISGAQRTINITHNNDILLENFPATDFSPVIVVEHWEEEY